MSRRILLVSIGCCLLALGLVATPLLVGAASLSTESGTLSDGQVVTNTAAGSTGTTGDLTGLNASNDTATSTTSDDDESSQNDTSTTNTTNTSEDAGAQAPAESDEGDDDQRDTDDEGDDDQRDTDDEGDDDQREPRSDFRSDGDQRSSDDRRLGGDRSSDDEDQEDDERWATDIRDRAGAYGIAARWDRMRDDRGTDGPDRAGSASTRTDIDDMGIGRPDTLVSGTLRRVKQLSEIAPDRLTIRDGADGGDATDPVHPTDREIAQGESKSDRAVDDRSTDGSTGDQDDSGSAVVDEPVPGALAAGAFLLVGSLGGLFAAAGTGLALPSLPLGGRSIQAGGRGLHAALADAARRGLPLACLLGYSRTERSEALDNDTRAQIYDVVEETPGVYHAKLADKVDVAEETVRYHSRILVKEGLVECHKHRGRRRLYPVQLESTEQELAAAVVDSAAADVLSVVGQREPTTLSEVADALECAPSTVAHHLDRLEEDGLVRRTRDGRSVSVRLRSSARSALDGSVSDD